MELLDHTEHDGADPLTEQNFTWTQRIQEASQLRGFQGSRAPRSSKVSSLAKRTPYSLEEKVGGDVIPLHLAAHCGEIVLVSAFAGCLTPVPQLPFHTSCL